MVVFLFMISMSRLTTSWTVHLTPIGSIDALYLLHQLRWNKAGLPMKINFFNLFIIDIYKVDKKGPDTLDKKGPPKEWLEKHYKGHGIYGYGNILIAKA
jgi:hypothetical protein